MSAARRAIATRPITWFVVICIGVYFVAVAISPLVREFGRISCATVGEPDWRRANTRSLDASLDSTDRTQRSPRASPLPARI